MSPFTWQSDGLYAEKRWIANGFVQIEHLYTLPHQDRPEVIAAWLETTGGQRTEFLCPIFQWRTSFLEQQCPSFCCTVRKSFDRYLAYQLDRALSSTSPKPGEVPTIPIGTFLNETGLHTLPSGNVCAVLGRDAIGAEGEDISLSPTLERLSVPHGIDRPLPKLFHLLLQQPPVVMLAASLAFLSVIRSACLDQVDFQAVGYIFGPSAVGKTVLAQRLFGFVGNTTGSRFHPAFVLESGATYPAVLNAMLEARDLPIVLDDIALSASRTSQQKRTDLAANIIREGANAAKIAKMRPDGTRVDMTCQATVILTAEITLQGMSELNRCILLPITRPLDLPSELGPELMGSSIRSFLNYITKRLSNKEQISWTRDLSDYTWRLNINIVQDLDKRVRKNLSILLGVLELVLSAALEEGLTPEEAEQTRSHFAKGLDDSTSAYRKYRQKVILRTPRGNLAWIISQGLKNYAFNLKRIERRKEILSSFPCDGVYYKDCLYLLPNALKIFVQRQYGYREYSLKKISTELAIDSILHVHQDCSNTVKLHKNAPRMYALDIEMLREKAEQF